MTITKSGEMASFYMINKAPIKHLRVYFSPKQVGEGDPSPENVRGISGWDEISTVFGATDLVQFDSTVERWTIPKNLLGTRVIYCAYINNQEGTQDAQLYIRFRAEDNTALQTSKSVQKIKPGNKGIIWSIFELRTDAKDLQLAVSGINISMVSERHLYIYKDKGLYTNFNSTIYGGYVDLITGELVQEWNKILFDGVNNKVNRGNYSEGDYFGGAVVYLEPNGLASAQWVASNLYADTICPRAPSEATNFPYLRLISAGRQYIRFMIFNKNDYEIMPSNNEVITMTNNWLQEHPTTIVYKLSTPITHQLTPQQLETFIGQNNIWSNADRVEVEYDLAESNDELYRRRNIILRGYPHIETASGNVASFSTDIAASLKEAKVYFEPIQEGDGDPSPDNIRPFSGWTGVDVCIGDPETNMCPVISGQGYFLFRPIPNVTYVISVDKPPSGYDPRFNYYNKDKISINYNTMNLLLNGRSYKTITFTSEQCEKIRYARITHNSILNNIRLCIINNPDSPEEKELKTVYVPFNGIWIKRDWSDIAGEIYGGYIDLLKGEVVSTHLLVTLTENENIIYGDWRNEFNCCHLEDPKFSFLHSTESNLKCNMLKSQIAGYYGTKDGYIRCVGGENTGFCYAIWRQDEFFGTTVESCKTKLKELNENGSPLQLTIPAQTRRYVTYPVDSAIIKTLFGHNTIWSNTNGPIEIKYWTH